jgi:hypothetical protein
MPRTYAVRGVNLASSTPDGTRLGWEKAPAAGATFPAGALGVVTSNQYANAGADPTANLVLMQEAAADEAYIRSGPGLGYSTSTTLKPRVAGLNIRGQELIMTVIGVAANVQIRNASLYGLTTNAGTGFTVVNPADTTGGIATILEFVEGRAGDTNVRARVKLTDASCYTE